MGRRRNIADNEIIGVYGYKEPEFIDRELPATPFLVPPDGSEFHTPWKCFIKECHMKCLKRKFGEEETFFPFSFFHPSMF